MRALLALLLVFATISMAKARLGESAEQLVARFGDATSTQAISQDPHNVFSGMTDMQFQKQGFYIEVILADPTSTGTAPISVSESYHPRSSMTETQIQALLTANSEGHKWKEEARYNGDRFWIRDDGAKAWQEGGSGNM